MLKRRRRTLGPGLLVLIGVGFVIAALVTPKGITVSLDGHPFRIDKGSTLDELLTVSHMHAKPGSLVDVDGVVIRAAATPGRVLLDGHERWSGTTLRPGDSVRVINGADREEDLMRFTRRVGRDIADPQFRLEKTPGLEIITMGKYSRKVKGVAFETKPGDAKPEKTVALTFDDGPSPLTPKILDVLKHYKVPATFFLVGVQVKKYPEMVRREVKMNMALGNHSWGHPIRPPFARLGDKRIRDEVERDQKAITDAGGRAVVFRPPGGSWSDETLELVKKAGLRTVLWSVDPSDWRGGRSSSTIASQVLSHVGPGSIVLLHDGGNNVASTLGALPRIIEGIRAKGLHLVTLTGAN